MSAGPVNVTGPEAAKPTALVQHVLVRFAAKFQIEILRGVERESRGALHMKIRRGRLIQFRLLVVDFFERHRRPTRLEKYVAVREFRFAIENML